jgi:NRPS condensation-like uncharacterized protein
MRAEPQDAFNHIAAAAADQQLSIVAAFEGHLDVGLLEAAVAAVSSAEPVLGCRYVPHRRRPTFEPVEASPFVTLTEAADPRVTAIAAAAVPLDPETERAIKVHLVRSGRADALVLTVHHVAADGQGAKAVLGMLAEAYSTLIHGGTPRLPAAGERGQRQILRRSGPLKLIASIRRRKAPRPTWGVPSRGEATTRTYSLLHLAPERLGAVKAYGKARGATVNDVLLAAFYRALFAVLEPEPGKPMIVNASFDLRRYLRDGAGASACNLSSVEPLAVPYDPASPFEATLATVRDQMAAYKAASPGLGSAALLELVWAVGGYARLDAMTGEPMRRGRAYGLSFPFLSNFGILPEDSLAFGGLHPAEAFVLPPASLPPFVMLGASTWRGTLTLAIGYPPDAMDPALVARLLAEVETGLRVTERGVDEAQSCPVR